MFLLFAAASNCPNVIFLFLGNIQKKRRQNIGFAKEQKKQNPACGIVFSSLKNAMVRLTKMKINRMQSFLLERRSPQEKEKCMCNLD